MNRAFGMRATTTLTPHEVTRWCLGHHCYGCDVDEPSTGRMPYRVCPECFHRYETARDLRRAHRRGVRQFIRAERRRPAHAASPGPADPFGLPDDRMPLRTAVLMLLALPWTRAANIDFCQICLHDF